MVRQGATLVRKQANPASRMNEWQVCLIYQQILLHLVEERSEVKEIRVTYRSIKTHQ